MPQDFLSFASKLKKVVESSQSQQLIFFKRKKSGSTSKYEAYNFELDQNSIGSKLKDIVISNIEKNKTCKLKPYTIELDVDEKNVVYEISSDRVINFKKIPEAMAIDKINRINIATTEDVDPNFYIINFDNNGEQVMVFTHYSPATTFKGKLFFNSKAETYKECLSIGTWVHCMYYRLKLDDEQIIENIVIFNNGKPHFEQIFDYKEYYKTTAVLTIKELGNAKLISNPDVLEMHAMKDEYFVRKLTKIKIENKIELVKWKFENLIKANNDFENLNIKIDEKNQTILIPRDAKKEYIKKALSLLNTEPAINMITEAKILISDNNNPVQQKLF